MAARRRGRMALACVLGVCVAACSSTRTTVQVGTDGASGTAGSGAAGTGGTAGNATGGASGAAGNATGGTSGAAGNATGGDGGMAATGGAAGSGATAGGGGDASAGAGGQMGADAAAGAAGGDASASGGAAGLGGGGASGTGGAAGGAGGTGGAAGAGTGGTAGASGTGGGAGASGTGGTAGASGTGGAGGAAGAGGTGGSSGTGGSGGGPTCTDGTRNGSETDVDCGGPTCPSCALGKACSTTADCVAGSCTSGRCVPAPVARWVNRSTAVRPPGRFGAALAHHAPNGTSVLFGGVTGAGERDDTWVYASGAWTDAAPATSPPPRHWHAMAHDSGRGLTVLHGGSGAVMFGDVWEWDGASWSERTLSGGPSPRSTHGLAYHSAAGVLVVFGGWNGLNYGDTWTLDGATGAWVNVATTGPSPRAFPAMGYDAARQKVVVFGGTTNWGSVTEALADTWTWDATGGWVQRTPATTPPARAGASLAWDPRRRVLILVGGAASPSAGSAAWTTDTWEWNGVDWRKTVDQSVAPGVGWGPTTAFDVARHRAVLFNGRTSGWYLNETWEYYVDAVACSADADCGSGFCEDSLCCAQIACGTCEACNLPGTAGSCAPVVDAPDLDSCPTQCDSAGTCP